MSAKHKSVTSLDDRVARMSDLRALVDHIAGLLTAQAGEILELRAEIERLKPPGTPERVLSLVSDASDATP